MASYTHVSAFGREARGQGHGSLQPSSNIRGPARNLSSADRACALCTSLRQSSSSVPCASFGDNKNHNGASNRRPSAASSRLGCPTYATDLLRRIREGGHTLLPHAADFHYGSPPASRTSSQNTAFTPIPATTQPRAAAVCGAPPFADNPHPGSVLFCKPPMQARFSS
jgi:hypothetical protein